MKIIKSILIFLTIISITTTVYADSDYIYSIRTAFAEPAPTAYEVRKSIRASDLGVDSLSKLTSIFVRDDKVYIADIDKIIITDKEFNTLKIISEFKTNSGTQKIKNPEGLFVTTSGDIYVAEPDNARILHFNAKYEFVRELLKPNAVGLEDVVYKPIKLVIDSLGRMFVVARNVYEGIMELTPEGEFSRFYGVNNVKFNPIDLFWRSIATEAQRKQMKLWLPTDFSNIAINNDGFIFSTSKGLTEKKALKMLNSKGEDILRAPLEDIRPKGDLAYRNMGYGIATGPSEFIAVDCNDYGMYTVLDAKRMRLFTYNEDGYLLYIFGGPGDRQGNFRNAVDVKFMDDDILIVDQMAQSIEVMKPTVYAQAINNAVKLQYEGNFIQASSEWARVSELNPNLNLAFIGMGKAELRAENYDKALEYFEAGAERKYYSKAFEKTRADYIDNNFGYIFLGVILIICLYTGVGIYKRIKYGKSLKPERGDIDDI